MSEFQIIVFSCILVFLIAVSAFFSSAETSLMAINRYRLRHKAQMKKRYALRIIQLLKRPDRLLGAILIGNTFATIFSSSLATLIAFHYWGDRGALLAAIILTFIMLIFAEIAPKTLAAIYPERVARWIAYPIQIVLKILYPLVWLANMITNGILRMLHIKVAAHAIEPLSREELRSIVNETTGKISRQYQHMLLSILDLSKLTVDDVMVPSRDIVGIDMEQSWNEILKRINQSQQEAIPVYRHNVNQMIGVLSHRDILKVLLKQTALNKDMLQQLLHEPYYVPEGTPLNVQLDYFQQSRNKLAFVVDEYGEIQGLLTLNDILEEIIGDFTSSIAHAKRIENLEDGSFLVDGAVTIREFNRSSEFELPLHARTVSGLIIEYLEALPHAGSAVLIGDYPIEIMDVKDNRVKLARVFPRYHG